MCVRLNRLNVHKFPLIGLGDYMIVRFFILLIILSVSSVLYSSEISQTKRLYDRHCGSCHGKDRLGRMAPALLPGNLKRLKRKKALAIILQGSGTSQMPGFSQKLSPEQAQAITNLIYTPLKKSPVWGLGEISKTHVVHFSTSQLSKKPLFMADPLNLFIVVEQGDHHATILDGDKLEAIHRFKTRFALHGGPKYSPDGRFVYLASRDGWISKFDIYNLKTVAEIRAGINTRNLAVSADGRYVLVGNYLPHSLVLLAADTLKPVQVIPVRDTAGKSSRVSAVYTAAPRNSFVVALKDLPEIWEIYYTDKHDPVYTGTVHDYRYKEGKIDTSAFPVRRIVLTDYLDDFFFDQSYNHVIGAARNAKNGQVVNLNIRRKIADLDLSGMPHLGSGITWKYKGRTVLATPNLKKSEISIIDMSNWKTIKRIKTLGPGFFMRSHENSRYAWTDVFFGPNKDVVHLIDKRSLKIVKTLRPSPGKIAAHVEFDRYGRYALLSVWDLNGELIVYNAKTLKEIKRIPMKKPSGKYNVYNKIHRSEGTSH